MKMKIDNVFFKKKIYPHILNGSGLAIGRMLLAIIETYTDYNGKIIIPDVLVRYLKKQFTFCIK